MGPDPRAPGRQGRRDSLPLSLMIRGCPYAPSLLRDLLAPTGTGRTPAGDDDEQGNRSTKPYGILSSGPTKDRGYANTSTRAQQGWSGAS